MSTAHVNHFRGVTQMVVAACVALLLAGCGGGDEDDPHPDIPTPAVNCAAQPELCK